MPQSYKIKPQLDRIEQDVEISVNEFVNTLLSKLNQIITQDRDKLVDNKGIVSRRSDVEFLEKYLKEESLKYSNRKNIKEYSISLFSDNSITLHFDDEQIEKLPQDWALELYNNYI